MADEVYIVTKGRKLHKPTDATFINQVIHRSMVTEVLSAELEQKAAKIINGIIDKNHEDII